jgi:hypothetical protein
MKQTVVEWLEQRIRVELTYKQDVLFDEVFEKAKAKEKSQNAKEYLKGFKDGKEYQIKLDELTFKSE